MKRTDPNINHQTCTIGKIKNYYAGATKVRSEYYSDAAGTALSKAYDYLAGMVFVESSGVKSLDFVSNPEGRALLTKKILGADLVGADKHRYEYSLKDHLGDLRLSCRCDEPKRDATGTVIPEGSTGYGLIPLATVQENAYDPWGLNFGNDAQKPAAFTDRYQYNGKEKIAELDLGWNDYGARMYMPEMGRWGAVDAFASDAPNLTAYRYGFNNPINIVDPDGNYEYSNGYQTLDSKNSTGSIQYSGAYQDGPAPNDCPSCPKDGKFDIFRNNSSLFTFAGQDKNGQDMVVNGDGNGATVTAPKWSLSLAVVQHYSSGHFFSTNPNDNNQYGAAKGPDAISLSIPITANGLFATGGFEIGIAFGFTKPGIALYFNELAGTKAAGVSSGINLNFHNTYGKETNVFNGMSDRSYGYDIQAFLGFGFSTSGRINSIKKAPSGTSTITLGLARPSLGSYGINKTISNTHIWYFGGN